MRIKLVQIGNSTGIRLPKAVIKECGFVDEVELAVRGDTVTLNPVSCDRSDWRDAFEADIQLRPIREKGEWEW